MNPPSCLSSQTKIDSSHCPSQKIPNFVAQYYQTSTFHHLSTWRLQYQRLVSQLNREAGPEFRPDDPDESTSSSSSSGNPDSESNSSCEYFWLRKHPHNKQRISSIVNHPNHLNSSVDLSFEGSFDSSSIIDSSSAAEHVSTSGDDLNISIEQQMKLYMHLDMDCFYASVMINRKFPQLRELPVVVCPAKNTNNGTSEVASANYVARKFGIRARMFVQEARRLCPNLRVLTCDFALIEDTSARMYEQILRYTHTVEAVSADEAYLDITVWGYKRAENLAERIRADILKATECECSIGIGPNKLVARLANKVAKPDQAFMIEQFNVSTSICNNLSMSPSPRIDQTERLFSHNPGIFIVYPSFCAEFLKKFVVADLPGVGPGTEGKLLEHKIETVVQLLEVPVHQLISWLGNKTGQMLFNSARAIDNRPLKTEQDRKSVGTQISWGVRMDTTEQVTAFLNDLTAEVCKRLEDIEMAGSKITLRVLKKKEVSEEEQSRGVIDARLGGIAAEQAKLVAKGESAKSFNPGNCIQISRSVKLPFASSDKALLQTEVQKLFRLIGIQPSELRGAGISVDDLEDLKVAQSKSLKKISSFFGKQVDTKPATSTQPSGSRENEDESNPKKRQREEEMVQSNEEESKIHIPTKKVSPPKRECKWKGLPAKQTTMKQGNILAMFGAK